MSVLSQRAPFDYEIVVGDDASTDGTTAVLTALAAKHPDQIVLMTRAHNLGMRGNFMATLDACKGELVAFLDGDDFWTARNKLARQVAFLDRHPDVAFCFHPARDLHLANDVSDRITPTTPPPLFTGFDYVLGETNPIAFGSVVARRKHLADIETWWAAGLKLGDWPASLLMASRGRVGYLRSEMSRYRLHEGGSWSTLSSHLRVANVLAMLVHIATLTTGGMRDQVEQRIAVLLEWWAGDVTLLGDDGADRLNRDLETLAQPDLLRLLLRATVTRGRSLEEARKWLEGHAKSWQTRADEQGALLMEAERALTKLQP